MESKTIANGILKALASIAGVALLLYFLYEIQVVIVYILIAAVLSLIGRPIILFFRRRLKFPNTLAVVITMLFMLLVLTSILLLFIPLINKQSQNLSLLDVEQLEVNIQNILNQFTSYFSIRGIEIVDVIKNIDIFSQFDVVPNLLNSILGTLGSFSVGLFSVLFIAFFFMKDSYLFKNALLTISPTKSESRFSNSIEIIKNLLSRYFIGLLSQITILFILYTIILLIFGISNAVVIAFLCALLNLIPYIGPLFGAILMTFLTMTSNLGLNFQSEILPKTIYVMIGYTIVQLIDNFVNQPIIFSKTTKSHPLEIFLIIVIGGLLFGIIGMIVAVPSYTALKVILKEFLAENKIVQSLTKKI